MAEYELRDDGGLSKTHIARYSSPTLLVHVVMSMVAIHAPSGPIPNQFLSGSVSVNLDFQLSDKTLKSSYLHILGDTKQMINLETSNFLHVRGSIFRNQNLFWKMVVND